MRGPSSQLAFGMGMLGARRLEPLLHQERPDYVALGRVS
jgi:hypothetical protein